MTIMLALLFAIIYIFNIAYHFFSIWTTLSRKSFFHSRSMLLMMMMEIFFPIAQKRVIFGSFLRVCFSNNCHFWQGFEGFLGCKVVKWYSFPDRLAWSSLSVFWIIDVILLIDREKVWWTKLGICLLIRGNILTFLVCNYFDNLYLHNLC